MHLVFINQYYPPDVAPTGVVLAAVVKELAAQGHEVTVICADGGYADQRQKTLRNQNPEGEGVAVIRIRATRFGRGSFIGKLLDYFSYYLGVMWHLAVMLPKPSRIVALTTPPYLSLLARVISKLRGADHAHWVMDIYPDVMVAHGILREGSLLHRSLAWLARWGMSGKRCAAVLTLGPDMADKLKDQRSDLSADLNLNQVSWIPLWSTGTENADELAVIKRRQEMGWGDDELVVMYSGNMGLGHRFGEILEVGVRGQESRASENELFEKWRSRDGLDGAQRSQSGDRGQGAEDGGRRAEDRVQVSGDGSQGTEIDETSASSSSIQKSKIVNHQSSIINNSSPTRFVFFGGGKRRGEIADFIKEHPNAPVELHDYASAENLDAHLRSADVHLVSLEAKWTGTMLPSKLQGVFTASRPVIFIGDENSSIGRWVKQSGGGWIVAPGDVAGLENAIHAAQDPSVRKARGLAAKAFAEANFDRQTNVRRVVDILIC